MSIRRALALAVAAFSFPPASLTHAAIVFDEAVSGDLSGSGLTPSSISLGVGSNQIFGSTGRDALGVDRDYFTVQIPAGYAFVSLLELAGTTVVSGVSFIAIQGGTQVTVSQTPVDATGLLGWNHFAPTAVDTEILAALGSGGFGATDFTPPLPAGNYAFWIQDTGLGSSSYGFDIVVAVPEPGAAAALLVGVVALGVARGRPRRG